MSRTAPENNFYPDAEGNQDKANWYMAKWIHHFYWGIKIQNKEDVLQHCGFILVICSCGV